MDKRSDGRHTKFLTDPVELISVFRHWPWHLAAPGTLTRSCPGIAPASWLLPKARRVPAVRRLTHIPFDINGDGAISFDINARGGPELDLIDRTIIATDPDQVRVVIVRDMKSFYYLDQPARAGTTTISVRGRNVFSSVMRLGAGATSEIVEVTSNTANTGHLAAPLLFDHAIGETMEFPAAGWSSDPILIAEGTTALDVTKWTILHEVGHTALELQDIIDRTDFMHFDQSNTDYRLRYCPRDSQYSLGVKENQWEKIPRPPVARTSTRAR